MASRDYYRNMSRRLSQVMDGIGVNGEAVMSRRRSFLIMENLQTLLQHLLQDTSSVYNLGSQSEGTTTDGLKSDLDIMWYTDSLNLIEDLNDWVPGKINLLMIQNERFPGYCKLQILKKDRPYPVQQSEALPGNVFGFDEAGRVLLRHLIKDGVERHGPAETVKLLNGFQVDWVNAIHTKTWPTGYKMWSTHPRKGNWPTPEMISYMENSGCFVVQVAHRLDEKKSVSWRISTSLAERCLMFSLNITQIRCYILIKMIVKTFIDPVIPDVISSYICKNLLFHCIENTRPDFWQESNLLRCVNQVLQSMIVAVLCVNCPDYFNESNNLWSGKVNKDNQVVLVGVIWKVLVSDGGFVMEIAYDNINESMHNYRETIYQRKDCSIAEKFKVPHSFKYEVGLCGFLSYIIQQLILNGRFNQRDLVSLQNTILLFARQGPLQYVSATLLFPFLCSHLATLKASEHIFHGEMLSDGTLYEQSIDSDKTSSTLKFASYLYCTGQFEMAMSALEAVDRLFVDGCIAVCGCGGIRAPYSISINMDPLSTKCLFPSNVSMCVMFSKAETRCCPREFQYEMYRSTEQEKLQRNEYGHGKWMDLACIDSNSYLCFLSYMTNRHIQNRGISLLALEELKKNASKDGRHRDTVYNLLGQCYEYENRFEEAFACYCKSLRVKPTNNAARWHIALLFYKVYQN